MNTTPLAPPVTPTAAIGLDISKDTLDACLLAPPETSGRPRHEKQFANSPSGHAKLLRWASQCLPDANLHFCLEATGSYAQAVARFLLAQAHAVSVVNPARIHFFALAQNAGHQNAGHQTDKADARLIALYGQQQQPAVWRVAAVEVQQLQALTRRWHTLSELCVQEKNRLAAPGQDKMMGPSMKRVLAALEREMQRLQLALFAAGLARPCQSASGLAARCQAVAKHPWHWRAYRVGHLSRDAGGQSV